MHNVYNKITIVPDSGETNENNSAGKTVLNFEAVPENYVTMQYLISNEFSKLFLYNFF